MNDETWTPEEIIAEEASRAESWTKMRKPEVMVQRGLFDSQDETQKGETP